MSRQPQKKKENLSLNDLHIVKDTEIKINEDFILPIKFDISKVTWHDVNIATFNMMKFYDKKAYDKILENKNKELNINSVIFQENKICLDITKLEYDKELSYIYNKKILDTFLKHVNVIDDIFEGKTIIEYIGCVNLVDWLLEIGLSNSDFLKIQNTMSFWIDYFAKNVNKKITELLGLKEEKETFYNQSMVELQIAYEYGNGCYFQENLNRACSEWSYREKILSKAYFTKKYLIDKAVNDELKNSIPTTKKTKA